MGFPQFRFQAGVGVRLACATFDSWCWFVVNPFPYQRATVCLLRCFVADLSSVTWEWCSEKTFPTCCCCGSSCPARLRVLISSDSGRLTRQACGRCTFQTHINPIHLKPVLLTDCCQQTYILETLTDFCISYRISFSLKKKKIAATRCSIFVFFLL